MSSQYGIVKSDLPRLKKLYNKALESGVEYFVFDGHELLVNYAKYLIEYLETLK